MRRLPIIALVIFGLLGLVPAVASAGPLTCPVSITHNMTLHADLDCTHVTSGYALTFAKPGLTLDLNGHKIIGPSGSDTATAVYTDLNNDTVKDGTIENFGYYGMYAYGAFHTVVSHVHFVADPSDSYSEAAYFYYGGANKVANSTADGFYYGYDFEYGAQNLLVHSTSTNSAYVGVYAYEETASRFVRNTVTGTGGTNTYAFQDYYSQHDAFARNVASGAGYGFYLYCDSYGTVTAVKNHAHDNVNDGFYVYDCYNDYGPTGSTLIRANTSKNNGGDGFYDYFSVNARYLGNVAGNNGDYGFNFDYPESQTINGNVGNGNHDDSGIYLEDNYSLYNVGQLANNTANNNSDYGIYADYGVPPSISPGNSAGGNPTQNCYNVTCS